MVALRASLVGAVVLLGMCGHAAAMDLDRAFGDAAARLVQQADKARKSSDFTLAASLLDEAAAKGAARSAVLLERGLVARDGGQEKQALADFKQAADLDSSSSARVDQAATLVALDRWPEAVVVLQQAFEERGSALPVHSITNDTRFSRLEGFAPYKQLISATSEEQAGPLGKLLLRLDQVEAAAHKLGNGVERLVKIFDAAMVLLSASWVRITLLLLLGTLVGSFFRQLRILMPPWTLLAGLVGAMALWHFGAELVTVGKSSGMETIGPAAVIAGIPMVAAPVLRWWWHRRRRRAATQSTPAAADASEDLVESESS